MAVRDAAGRRPRLPVHAADILPHALSRRQVRRAGAEQAAVHATTELIHGLLPGLPDTVVEEVLPMIDSRHKRALSRFRLLVSGKDRDMTIYMRRDNRVAVYADREQEQQKQMELAFADLFHFLLRSNLIKKSSHKKGISQSFFEIINCFVLRSIDRGTPPSPAK
ncbi:hypothetical protein NKR23_g2141 [Pleurostoma richardsiae]|uniref:Uncharacterized protein n=1 Tax=Pleurostoma richardsiae TaxID=41990 RepID=A0AA38RNA8_9PEZI|nr:hypothetical protein NKR23_g2141 [Pleurostoma richardsiae]